jgi:catechol 2,3-dioxygenase-like lactoylglutathione lyase family enzyme
LTDRRQERQHRLPPNLDEGDQMLGNARVAALLPTTDLAAAQAFYGDTLGLRLIPMEGPVVYEAGADSTLELLPRSEPTKADHTVAAFRVPDIAGAVQGLEAKGVVFEEYEGMVNHVLEFGPTKLAWFKDPDGNLIALSEDDRLT